MTVGLLIAQIAIYLITFAVAAYDFFVRCDEEISTLITLIVGTVINVVLSCTYEWCGITIGLTSVAITGILMLLTFVLEDEAPLIFATISGLIAVIILVFGGFAWLFGCDFSNSTEEIAYVEEQRINIVSSADKGISDTSIRGSSNLLFGTVTGTTTLTYYYSYYYQEKDGSLHIGTVPSDITKLYTLTEEEQPYVKILTNHHKTINLFTGLPSEEIHVGSTSYELYVPKSAIPTNFTYDLN